MESAQASSLSPRTLAIARVHLHPEDAVHNQCLVPLRSVDEDVAIIGCHESRVSHDGLDERIHQEVGEPNLVSDEVAEAGGVLKATHR